MRERGMTVNPRSLRSGPPRGNSLHELAPSPIAGSRHECSRRQFVSDIQPRGCIIPSRSQAARHASLLARLHNDCLAESIPPDDVRCRRALPLVTTVALAQDKAIGDFPKLSATGDWPCGGAAHSQRRRRSRDVPRQVWRRREHEVEGLRPGRGHSSPVVVGKLVFLTTADERQQVHSVLGFDRATGKQLAKIDVSTGAFPEHNHPKKHGSDPDRRLRRRAGLRQLLSPRQGGNRRPEHGRLDRLEARRRSLPPDPLRIRLRPLPRPL